MRSRKDLTQRQQQEEPVHGQQSAHFKHNYLYAVPAWSRYSWRSAEMLCSGFTLDRLKPKAEFALSVQPSEQAPCWPSNHPGIRGRICGWMDNRGQSRRSITHKESRWRRQSAWHRVSQGASPSTLPTLPLARYCKMILGAYFLPPSPHTGATRESTNDTITSQGRRHGHPKSTLQCVHDRAQIATVFGSTTPCGLGFHDLSDSLAALPARAPSSATSAEYTDQPSAPRAHTPRTLCPKWLPHRPKRWQTDVFASGTGSFRAAACPRSTGSNDKTRPILSVSMLPAFHPSQFHTHALLCLGHGGFSPFLLRRQSVIVPIYRRLQNSLHCSQVNCGTDAQLSLPTSAYSLASPG
jgi:hypothetical protein